MAATETARRKNRASTLPPEKIDQAIYLDERAYWLAIHHHRTHRNRRFSFERYQFAVDILRDNSQNVVIMSSTQAVKTEAAIIRGFGWMEYGLNVFWVLPTGMLKNRFVKNRVDMSIAHTPWYHERLRDERTILNAAKSASMSLKNYADGAIAYIGSNSPTGFGEFPADVAVIDEFDECEQAYLPMAEERLSNSEHRIMWRMGNPTITGRGISALFKESDQKRWYVRGACGHVIRPQWVRHVVRKVADNSFEVIDSDWDGLDGADARIICDVCGKPIDRNAEGWWEAENPKSTISGYHISKLFSTRMAMNEMLRRFEKGLTDPTMAQRFWNGDMGEPFSAPGARILDQDIDEAIRRGGYSMPQTVHAPCVVGVDVGSVLHVAIGQLLESGRIRVVFLGTAPCQTSHRDLLEIVRRFDVRAAVIDHQPETRFARKLAYHFRRWFMCKYGSPKRDSPDPKSKMITVDRTVALDAVNERFMLGTIDLPQEANGIEGFRDQLAELTRVYNKDANGGEGAYEWQGDGPDHYFHALAYMLIARRLITGAR